eukprot:TRINITY_DN63019_c0_g1_i1.p1 TRINITY_DN63019_c0_g1~~TRINITY_DN63019_c0_g1_i1.p1  ORF type:complete len:656 (+),score=42.92 TRINITY_DN63019_c0_g1_i1:72-2039(+)
MSLIAHSNVLQAHSAFFHQTYIPRNANTAQIPSLGVWVHPISLLHIAVLRRNLDDVTALCSNESVPYFPHRCPTFCPISVAQPTTPFQMAAMVFRPAAEFFLEMLQSQQQLQTQQLVTHTTTMTTTPSQLCLFNTRLEQAAFYQPPADFTKAATEMGIKKASSEHTVGKFVGHFAASRTDGVDLLREIHKWCPKALKWEATQYTPFMVACATGNLPTAQWLLETCYGNLMPEDDTDAEGRNGLLLACQVSGKVVRWLIQHGNADINFTDNFNRGLLHYAASVPLCNSRAEADPEKSYGEETGPELLKWLLEETSLSATSVDHFNETALGCGASWGNTPIVAYLHPLIENKSGNRKKDIVPTALWHAASGGHVNIVEWLVSNTSVDLYSCDSMGLTATHRAAMEGMVEVVSWLYQSGKIVLDQLDLSDRTPLQWAAKQGYLNTVQWLHQAGADLNHVDAFGATPLITAAQHDRLEVVKWIVETDSSCCKCRDNRGRSALHRAAHGKWLATVQYLVCTGHFDCNEKDFDGQDILFTSLCNCGWDVCIWLIQMGACNLPVTLTGTVCETITFPVNITQLLKILSQPWSKNTHHLFSFCTRLGIRLIMLLRNRDETYLSEVPEDVVFWLFEFFPAAGLVDINCVVPYMKQQAALHRKDA